MVCMRDEGRAHVRPGTGRRGIRAVAWDLVPRTREPFVRLTPLQLRLAPHC